MKDKHIQAVLVSVMFSILVLSGLGATNSINIGYKYSPALSYVDSVVYEAISDSDERWLALENRSIDAYLGSDYQMNVDNIDDLEANPDIEIYKGPPRNGYGFIVINCLKYPLNITGLRQAFAYAFDKTRATEINEGYSVEHDSVVPLPSQWCYENGLPWHYYNARPDIGNAILDRLGFSIDGATGYRLAPDDTPFDIKVMYGVTGVNEEIAQVAMDALLTLSINATLLPVDPFAIWDILNPHEDFDMAFTGRNFLSDDGREGDLGDVITWLATEFRSNNLGVFGKNLANFANATFDSWRNQILQGITFEEIYEAAAEMQKILHENVPYLIVYDSLYFQAYRADALTGHVEDLRWGISGPWSNLEVHNKQGTPFGGTFKVALETAPDTFNIFKIDEECEEVIIDNLYSSLYKVGPDRKQYSDLATTCEIETSGTNPSVAAGQLWLTFDIRQDAVWSDSTPLTADDVAFTFDYIYLSGNPLATNFAEFVSSEVISPSRVKLVFNSEVYWDYDDVFNTKIIPEHIFNDDTGIGYAGWSGWDPVFNPADPHVTCGPFTLSSHDATSFTLTRNPEHHWPTHPPVVLSADNVTYMRDSTGNKIIWEVADDDPSEYSIIHGGTQLVLQAWNGSDIVYNVDGLPIGTFNVTLVLRDESLNEVTSTVWVTVIAAPGELPDYLLIGISVAAAIIIVAVAVVFVRKRP